MQFWPSRQAPWIFSASIGVPFECWMSLTCGFYRLKQLVLPTKKPSPILKQYFVVLQAKTTLLVRFPTLVAWPCRENGARSGHSLLRFGILGFVVVPPKMWAGCLCCDFDGRRTKTTRCRASFFQQPKRLTRHLYRLGNRQVVCSLAAPSPISFAQHGRREFWLALRILRR